MFDADSRYQNIDNAEIVDERGRTIVYKKRRFLPDPDGATPLVIATFTEGDRIDLLAARNYGDPEAFWRICDAHRVLHPRELERPNTQIVVPMPKPGE